MRLLKLVLASALLGGAVAAAQGLDAPIERYREATAFHQVGSLRGRVFQERRRPTGSDSPLTGTALVLLPRSEAWLFRLEAIKRGARDSAETYRAAGPAVRQAREAYEKALLEAGAGDLSQHGATVDGDGRFALDGVPAGPWVLFASRSTYVSKAAQERPGGPGVPGREPKLSPPFLPHDTLAGYSVVTYWLREVSVTAGAVETVDLTDRNVWLTGVIESRQAPRPPDQPYQRRR